MKSFPQHACDSCCEFIAAVKALKHEAQNAKRLPVLEDAQGWICELQVKLGALETLATEIKGFVLPSVATAAVRQHSDEIPPARSPEPERVPCFPTHHVTPPPADYQETIPS